jgi:hypothetical protein
MAGKGGLMRQVRAASYTLLGWADALSSWFAEKGWRRLVLALFFSAVVCLFLVFCVNPSNTDDDWSISLYLSGRIPGEGLCLFVNAALSQLIYALNASLPSANWFFAVEHLSSFLAFAVLVYGALTYMRPASGMILVGLVCVFVMPYCIASSNYTYVSALATCAGGCLLVGEVREGGCRILEAVAAVGMLALGMCWRFEMFLPCSAFVCLAWAWTFLFERDWKSRGPFKAAVIVPALVVLLVCGGLHAYDRATWQQDGWRQWDEYNVPRQKTSDYELLGYDEAKETLDAIGLSENDYWLIQNWGNADSDVFNAQVLAKVAELRVPPFGGGASLASVFASYVSMCARRWRFFLPLILALAFARPARRRTWIPLSLELVVAFSACLYFLAVGRLLPRVEDPIWLLALSMGLVLAGRRRLAVGENDGVASRGGLSAARQAASVLPPVLLLCCLVSMVMRWVPSFSVGGFERSFQQASYVAAGPFSTYVESHPGDHYVIESGVMSLFDMEYEHRYLPAEELESRTMSLGGWGSGSPFRRAQCAAVGATNPYQALLTGSSTYLIAREAMASRVLEFLRQHYDATATCSQVDSLELEGETIPVWQLAGHSG